MPLVQKPFGDIITFTRASTATYFDATGTLQSAAIDAPRFDYNPATLAARGFLIEEARTNSIRNNTMQGAVAGTPGTLPTNWAVSTTGAATYQVVGTGTENGINYIDVRFQGAGAADTWNLIYDTTVVAANGQTWVSSVYLKLAAGSTANIPFVQRMVFRDSGFLNIQAADSSAITPTSAGLATQRSTLSLTATQAATAFVTSQLNSATPTGAYDITLRIGLPQLELGAFATSVIPTTTTALTRSADVASVNTLSPWFNASEGTVYAEFSTFATTTGFGGAWGFGDNTLPFANAETIYVARTNATNSTSQTVIDNGVSQGAISSGSGVAPNTVGKVASTYKLNDVAVCVNGAAVGVDPTVTIPTVTGLSLGSLQNAWSGGGNYINGYLRRITYYPRRLSNAELQGITA